MDQLGNNWLVEVSFALTHKGGQDIVRRGSEVLTGAALEDRQGGSHGHFHRDPS
jgi:hypothetical protein